MAKKFDNGNVKKSELLARVHEVFVETTGKNVSKKDVESFADAFETVVKEQVKGHKKFKLFSLFNIGYRQVDERKGVTSLQGVEKEYIVPAHNVLAIKVSNEGKDIVNGKENRK